MIFRRKKPREVDMPKRTFKDRLTWHQILWRHKSAVNPAQARIRHISPKINKKVSIISTLLVVSVVLVLIFVSNIRVSHIECVTQYGKCPNDIELLTQKLINQRVTTVNIEEFNRNLSQERIVKSVNTHREGISGVIVSLVLRVPLGNIQSDIAGSNSSIIDEDGYVIKNESSPLLSSLIVENWSLDTKKATTEQARAVKALEEIKKISNRKSIGSLNGLELTASTGDGPKIIINLEKPFESWLSSLQVILERSRISSKQPEKIDLRFNNPVLVYSK